MGFRRRTPQGGSPGVLVELGVAEQRYRAVLEVLDEGASVTDVARRYGVARRTPPATTPLCAMRRDHDGHRAHHRPRPAPRST